MMIMDAGVHVWPPQSPDRPWMPGRKAHLPEPMTYEKFSAMMKGAGVAHAILVPPSWEGDRVDYVSMRRRNIPIVSPLWDAFLSKNRRSAPSLKHGAIRRECSEFG